MARNLFAFLDIYEELYSINQIKVQAHGNKNCRTDKNATRDEAGKQDCLIPFRTAVLRAETCQRV